MLPLVLGFKKVKKNNEVDDKISIGDHLLLSAQVHKSGNRLLLIKFKNKCIINKISTTVISNYGNDILTVYIDFGKYEFFKNEKIINNCEV